MIYILLPCFNEYKNLTILIDKINQLKTYNFGKINLIIVNDGSTDKTDIKINYLKKKSKNSIIYIKHNKNLGLNMSLLSGFQTFIKKGKKNDIIVTLDSDNTHPISLIPKIIKPIKKNGYDIVIASRFQPGSNVTGLNLFRKSLSDSAKLIYKLIFSIKNVQDYTCNYRGYSFEILKRSGLIKRNFFIGKDFSVVPDILINLNSKFFDLKIKEVPLKLRYDFKIGESKLNVPKNIIKTLLLIIRNIRN